MSPTRAPLLALAATVALAAAARAEAPPPAPTPATAAQLQTMLKLFAPVPITVDVAALPASEKKALAKLIEAARIMDGLFLRQAWAGNLPLLIDLAADGTPLGRARLQAFLLNKGPWDRLEHNRAFLPNVPAAKPAPADFYPLDATKADVETWMKSLPPADRARAEGFYTLIRRGTDGKLGIVPYAVAYAGELATAAKLLEEAAQLTAEPTLRTFLQKRAAAFTSNDYYDSDVAWMNLAGQIGRAHV